MDFTRSITERSAGRSFITGGLLPMSWMVGSLWIFLVYLPYLFAAGLAGAPNDPEAWLAERRCWGLSHITILTIANAGVLLFALGDLAGKASGGMGILRWSGYGALVLLLAAAQLALGWWPEVVALLVDQG